MAYEAIAVYNAVRGTLQQWAIELKEQATSAFMQMETDKATKLRAMYHEFDNWCDRRLTAVRQSLGLSESDVK